MKWDGYDGYTGDSMTTSEPKRLVAALPELAEEIQRMLAERGESKLAEQVQELNLIERCRCGDDFCATFYVLPKPVGAYGFGIATSFLRLGKGY